MRKEPIHTRAKTHIIRTAGVCNEWCRQWRMYDRLLPTAFLCGVALFLGYYLTLAAPVTFQSASLIKVSKEEPIAVVAQHLKEKHLIHSTLVFTFFAKLFGADKHVMAGEYFFPGPQNVITISRRLAHGDYQLVPVRVTFPEGITVSSMAEILQEKVPDFDVSAFLSAAEAKEGYLFPDTYFFLPGQDATSVITTLEANFKQHVSKPEVASALAQSKHTLTELVTMASLLEKEAATFHDRQVIAGVLWHRLAIGMPLQVDAVFPYIIGKNTFELTKADLKVASPYNTYTNKGLPPGPINNPSIGSIVAAATPISSNYVYYLSDMQGNFHFCVNYACQKANQQKYLK